MGEIETVDAEKMEWLDLPRGTSYPTFPYLILSFVFYRELCPFELKWSELFGVNGVS